MNNVLKLSWEESERGWGVRPDGCSLHLTQEDAAQYVKEYWSRQPDGPAPDEYERPGGEPQPFSVSDELFEKVKATKNGFRIQQWEMKELKQ